MNTKRLLALLTLGWIAAAGVATIATPEAQAAPGQCFTSPFGGFCDGDMLPGGVYRHCEGALGWSNCFYVKPVPVEVDTRGWVPA
ncbi:hypothetical protein [Mycolicibacterium fortuitum]|uniref:hypothetical protein n=1 Tax=Mycolicibacterium fortuitum TaxID=1766 RepID=UPI002604AFD0|nr:hypothetical protein [Mycolicibacterium fortuitum]